MGVLYSGTLLALITIGSVLFGVGYKQNKVSLWVFTGLLTVMYAWCYMLAWDFKENKLYTLQNGLLQLATLCLLTTLVVIGVNRRLITGIYITYAVLGLVFLLLRSYISLNSHAGARVYEQVNEE